MKYASLRGRLAQPFVLPARAGRHLFPVLALMAAAVIPACTCGGADKKESPTAQTPAPDVSTPTSASPPTSVEIARRPMQIRPGLIRTPRVLPSAVQPAVPQAQP